MNRSKIGHRLAQLIARRKVGSMGEFNYVCLRTGEERSGRGEILELVKEKDKEGWEKLINLCERGDGNEGAHQTEIWSTC